MDTTQNILTTRLDEFLQKREPPKTFCPSEVARALTSDELRQIGWSTWRDAMPTIRQLAWDRSDCEVVQKGSVVEGKLDDIVGPIRLRRAM